MTTAALIAAALAGASLAWLAQDAVRDRRRRAHWQAIADEQERRLERMQERAVAANGHPRTGNVEHLGTRRP